MLRQEHVKGRKTGGT